jgi:hypothetical protein
MTPALPCNVSRTHSRKGDDGLIHWLSWSDYDPRLKADPDLEAIY